MDDFGDLAKNLNANLQKHEDYLHYLNVEYPKQLQEHIKKELIKKNLREMDAAMQAELDKRRDEATASRRHKQLLFAAIAIPIIVLIVTLMAMKS